MPSPPPPPPPPTPSQLLTDLENLIHLAMPLIEDAYIFSQVVGNILVAADQTSGPPPTYYIGDAADNPSAQDEGSEQDPGPEIVQIFNVNGTSGGFKLMPDGSYEVYAGNAIIATESGTSAGPAGVINGNPTVLSGAGMFPVAGEKSSSYNGPLVPGGVTNVYGMQPYADPADPSKHMFYTCNGAGTNWNPNLGPGYDLSNDPRVQQYFTWAGVSYEGAFFPMWPSIEDGIQKMANLIASTHGTFAIAGYSEGAIVSCRVWRDYILNPEGQLHDRLNDIIGHVSWGNPMRCPTIANGNPLAGLAIPGVKEGYATGGIAGPDDLTPWQTMNWHIDFAHEGDLYADCPVGLDPWSNEAPPGEMETAIYKLVAEGDIAGRDSLLLEVGEILTHPFKNLIPLLEALINGIQFLADQSPHQDYSLTMDAAGAWLGARGQQVPVRKS